MPVNEINFEELEAAYEQEILTYGDFLKMQLFWLSGEKESELAQGEK